MMIGWCDVQRGIQIYLIREVTNYIKETGGIMGRRKGCNYLTQMILIIFLLPNPQRMKILEELKYQVEQKMHKDRQLSGNDKVLFLTKVLYDRLSVKEACKHLRLPLTVGQAVLEEHNSLLKTKTKYKNLKRSTTLSTTSSHESAQVQESTQTVERRAAGYKTIAKKYDGSKFSITFSVNGQPISHRTMKVRYYALIRLPQPTTQNQ